MLLRAVFRAVCGVVFFSVAAAAAAQTTAKTDCLFRNPLCFYDMDVLGYVQTLHRYQRYNEAAAFFYGPEVDRLGRAGVARWWGTPAGCTSTRPLGLTSSRQIPASGQFTRMGVWDAVPPA
ncbi:MAG: hypothetical protein RLZZ275_143 [Bacteroidota bacterium]